MNNGWMEVKILSLKNGYEYYDKVKAIRIKSKEYNLLIMKDYMPLIGKIEGQLDIEREENSIHFDYIEGFYMLTNDSFELIVRSESNETK